MNQPHQSPAMDSPVKHHIISQADRIHADKVLSLLGSNENQNRMVQALLEKPRQPPEALKRLLGVRQLSDIATRLNRRLTASGYGVSCESPAMFGENGTQGFQWSVYRIENAGGLSKREMLRRQLAGIRRVA